MVDFLDPSKFHKLGGGFQEAYLFQGQVKPYLHVPLLVKQKCLFYTISGSDFVEFVGVGAARVRDMFEQAKKFSLYYIY